MEIELILMKTDNNKPRIWVVPNEGDVNIPGIMEFATRTLAWINSTH